MVSVDHLEKQHAASHESAVKPLEAVDSKLFRGQ